MESKMIVVAGAGGKLGRAVARALEEAGATDLVRLATRAPVELQEFAKPGREVHYSDYAKPDSLARAFEGATSLLIVSSVGSNEERIAQHANAIDAAKRAGVRRVVYTSVLNAVPESRFLWAKAHVETEARLKASDLPCVILRVAPYASNLDEFILRAKETGTLTLPTGAGKVAYVLHEDIAACAAAALLGKGKNGETIDVAGGALFDAGDVAAALSEVLGKPIARADLPLAAYAPLLVSRGLPQPVAEAIASFSDAAGAGEYAVSGEAAAKLAGRPMRTLRDHLKKFA
jgi:NAD(P)H dehydrogenase (quinone)